MKFLFKLRKKKYFNTNPPYNTVSEEIYFVADNYKQLFDYLEREWTDTVWEEITEVSREVFVANHE